MSHFVVLVFGDDVDGQLERFYEQGEPSDSFMEFEDHTEEVEWSYENDTERKIKMPDGRLLDPWDKEFRIPDTIGISTDTHHVPSHLEKIDVPVKDLYPSMDEFAEDYHGYSTIQDPHLGTRYGYYCNPDAKWDWWVIGGRWTGYFKVKEGCSASLGEPGVFGNAPQEGYADQLRIKDIDFDGMYGDAMAEAAEIYDRFEKVTEGLEPAPSWEYVWKEMFPNDIDAARKWYSSYPWVKALRKANLDPFFGDALEVYFVGKGGREAYIENSKCRALLPFAVVIDGEWYEKGEMGWFGFAANEKTQYDWSAKFHELWEQLDPETLVTVVDCHI